MRILHNLRLFLTGLIDKIFPGKTLAKLEGDIDEKDRLIRLLTSGYIVHLNQQETLMILLAIEQKVFRGMVALPKTKAVVRRTWRDLREKIKLHLKEV